MTASRFKLPEDFYRKLHSHLLTELQRENPSRAQSSASGFLGHLLPMQIGLFGHRPQPLLSEVLPNLDHLIELIDVAFWASLDRVEGHHLSFSVGYEKRQIATYNTFSFSPGLPFKHEVLRNLAPAIESPESCAIVFPDQAGHLTIQGVSKNWTSPLTIKVLDPGRLIIRFNFFNRAVISGSEAVLIKDHFLAQRKSIWPLFTLKNDESGLSDFDPRISTILSIVRRMRQMGHGGILVIAPDNDEWAEYVRKPLAYPTNEKFSPAEFMLDSLNRVKEGEAISNSESDLLTTSLKNTAESIAQLTAVDGAVITEK